MIESKLRILRTQIRKNYKSIVDHIVENNINRWEKKKIWNSICCFCGSWGKITKEHVLPVWTFEWSVEKFFTTSINGQPQTYNKTTVSVCSYCNNNILANIESYINKILLGRDLLATPFSDSELENIIRWFEIIDYKFHVLNAKRTFLNSKENWYIPYLADFSLSVLRPELDYSPVKAISEIRYTLKRLSIKDKLSNINSLVIFRTKNKGFHFFHNMNDFIFIELPQYKIAMFYFYKNIYSTSEDWKNAAMKVIKEVY